MRFDSVCCCTLTSEATEEARGASVRLERLCPPAVFWSVTDRSAHSVPCLGVMSGTVTLTSVTPSPSCWHAYHGGSFGLGRAEKARRVEPPASSWFFTKKLRNPRRVGFWRRSETHKFQFIHARSRLLIFCSKMKQKKQDCTILKDVYKTWFPLPCYANWSRHQRHTAGYFLEHFCKVKMNNKYVLLQKKKLRFIGGCPIRV